MDRALALWMTVILTASVVGCGGGGAPLDEPPWNFQVAPEVAARVERVRSAVLGDTCFRTQQDVSGCDWGDFPFETSRFAMEHDTGEAILIIDEFSALPPRAIRYQNRLKGFFRVDGEGTLVSVPAAGWRAPTRLFQGLSEFADARFIPAEHLRALREPLETTYEAYEEGSIGHGSFVFSLLVEANPHQSIVLLDTLTFQRFAPEEFCDASGAPESMLRLREKSQRVADQLRQLMASQNIRFVNLSSGQTLDSVRADWREFCGGTIPSDEVLRARLAAYAPIADVLFNTPGVFTAQAAIEGSSREDFPFDFPSVAYPNRMLAGYLTTLESGLEEDGRQGSPALSGWPGRQNVDVYLNSGVLPRRPFTYNRTPLLQVNGFGVEILPITLTSTSWIAPLALSRFIHIRYSRFAGCEMSDELISRIRDVMVPGGCEQLPEGRCVYQDPLKHGQLEAIRLGYRPREYLKP